MGENVDGVAVDAYGGRFATAVFDLNDEDSRNLRYDDAVVMVVVGRVQLPAYKESTSGGIKRISVVRPDRVLVLDEGEALRSDVMELLGVVEQLRLEGSPTSDQTEVKATGQPGEFEADRPTDSPPPAAEGPAASEEPSEEEVFSPGSTGVRRVHPTPSTVGASAVEHDPVLADFLAGGE